jgi:hypothetical protein
MQEVGTRERIWVLFNFYSLYTTYFMTKKPFQRFYKTDKQEKNILDSDLPSMVKCPWANSLAEAFKNCNDSGKPLTTSTLSFQKD